MSITLPTYFKSDIQGSNTNLVPFVLIGNNERKTIVDEEHSVWDKFYFLSTNRIRLGRIVAIIIKYSLSERINRH